MINILDKKECCGCNACGDICPHNAIVYETDNEGFWYPHVDEARCIGCGLCDKVCPIINSEKSLFHFPKPDVYAAYNKDESIRLDSTSGGIFSAFALNMYKKSAYVGGAVYQEDHSVSQIIDKNPECLARIRSSKYLQSNAAGVYKEIHSLLNQGESVFFCGCPCQIQALNNFLGKDYPALVTCDFVCRGVNSPKVFLKHIEGLESRYKARATEIKFKDKKRGWHNFSLRVRFANGKEYNKDRWHDPFFIGYLQSGLFTRPSCYACRFKGTPEQSDITLADFWGIENILPEMDQDKGTSLVLINSEKGRLLFDDIKDSIVWKASSLEQARMENPAIDESLIAASFKRAAFFRDLDIFPFNKVASRYFPLKSFKTRMKESFPSLTSLFRLCAALGISPSAWKTFLAINFISPKVSRRGKLLFYNKSRTVVQLDEDARLSLSAKLTTGIKQVKGSRMETRILLEQGSKLEVRGPFQVFGGSYIRVVPGGSLILEGGFINENVQMTIGSEVRIGPGFTCGRDVTIRSFDGHTINEQDYQISAPITIGSHVWVGQGATILKGVTIGDGAVIASGALVTKDVPAHAIAAGVPARVIRENITWQ